MKTSMLNWTLFLNFSSLIYFPVWDRISLYISGWPEPFYVKSAVSASQVLTLKVCAITFSQWTLDFFSFISFSCFTWGWVQDNVLRGHPALTCSCSHITLQAQAVSTDWNEPGLPASCFFFHQSCSVPPTDNLWFFLPACGWRECHLV